MWMVGVLNTQLRGLGLEAYAVAFFGVFGIRVWSGPAPFGSSVRMSMFSVLEWWPRWMHEAASSRIPFGAGATGSSYSHPQAHAEEVVLEAGSI